MSSTGAAVLKMNYESKLNKNILLFRFKTLQTSAAWYPLTLAKEWYVIRISWATHANSKADFT